MTSTCGTPSSTTASSRISTSPPFEIDETSDEFLAPFHMIVNLAIGGGFTDAYSLGDPGSGAAVSMPFPAEMYVDYIRIYKWNGMGEVHLGPPVAQGGTFGLYTEQTPVDGSLEPEVTSQIYVWEGTLTDGALEPYEGEDVLSWRSVGLGWFGAGIMSVQPLNLFGFGDGTLEFMIKIPAGGHLQDRHHRQLGEPVLCPVPRQPDDLRADAQRGMGPGHDPPSRTFAARPSTCACSATPS